MYGIGDIKIDGSTIGDRHKPFIIAEMSGNHNKSLDRALAIVQAAADSGAHALKLQTYTADTMTLKGSFTIKDKNSLWNNRELFDLYQEAFTPWEWHEPIFTKARSLGMIPFSTPFDDTAVDFLEKIGVEIYKVASFENTDLPLLKKIASTGKPVIISSGVAEISDIDEALRTLRGNGCNQIVLLKCTSTYPSSPENTNLLTIPHMRDLFRCHIGISDHTLGIGASIASVALGAKVIEKHLTLDRGEGGIDAAFSMEPHEFKMLVDNSEIAFVALGEIMYGIQEDERLNTKFKRSLYISEDMHAGDILTDNNIRIIRPGLGLAPKYLDIVIGKKVNKNVSRGTALTFDLIG